MSKKICEHLKQVDFLLESDISKSCTYCKKCKEILDPKNLDAKTIKLFKREIKAINKKFF